MHRLKGYGSSAISKERVSEHLFKLACISRLKNDIRGQSNNLQVWSVPVILRTHNKSFPSSQKGCVCLSVFAGMCWEGGLEWILGTAHHWANCQSPIKQRICGHLERKYLITRSQFGFTWHRHIRQMSFHFYKGVLPIGGAVDLIWSDKPSTYSVLINCSLCQGYKDGKVWSQKQFTSQSTRWMIMTSSGVRVGGINSLRPID